MIDFVARLFLSIIVLGSIDFICIYFEIFLYFLEVFVYWALTYYSDNLLIEFR